MILKNLGKAHTWFTYKFDWFQIEINNYSDYLYSSKYSLPLYKCFTWSTLKKEITKNN